MDSQGTSHLAIMITPTSLLFSWKNLIEFALSRSLIIYLPDGRKMLKLKVKSWVLALGGFLWSAFRTFPREEEMNTLSPLLGICSVKQWAETKPQKGPNRTECSIQKNKQGERRKENREL